MYMNFYILFKISSTTFQSSMPQEKSSVSSGDLYTSLNQEIYILGILFLILIVFTLGCFFFFKLRQSQTLLKELKKLKEKISCDLHDEIGINLAGISLMTQSLKKKYSTDLELINCLNEIHHAAWETDLATQEIVALLESKDDFKIDSYLKKMILRFCSKYETNFSIDPMINLEKLPLLHKQNILLFFKEALHNIIRHSQAKRISFQIIQETSGISFNIHDDGIGFDIHQPKVLNKLKKRCEHMNGELTISSSKEDGTQLNLSLKN